MKKCTVSEKCGGCAYQGLVYEKQLARKEEYVRKLYKGVSSVEKITGSDPVYRYRNKAQISFEQGKDGHIRMGNYAGSTHRIIPVKDCQLLPELTNEIFLTVKELAEIMGGSHQNVKQILLKLEKKGFVRITVDEKDKRKQRVGLTQKCREFCEANDEKSMQAIITMFEGVSREQLQITIQTIMQMEDNLKKL